MSVEQVKSMVEEQRQHLEEAKTLWAELEEVEDGDKSFYKNFTMDTSNTPTQGFMHNLIQKMGEVKVHFTTLLEEPKVSSKGRSQQPDLSKMPEYPLSMVIKAVKNLQVLVKDHGLVLEFIRELFNRQEVKLNEVERRVLNPGVEVTNMIDLSLDNKLDAKTQEISTKVAELETKLDVLESDNKLLKKKNKQLTEECDETRQRGLKGNLRISCPYKRGEARKDELEVRNGRRETTTEMVLRLIQEKTGCNIQMQDVVACHRLPENDFSYILRVGNRAPGSGWEALAAGMVSGRKYQSRDYFANNGVYLNFQLTEARSNLLNQVRLARKRNLLAKFSVNQNGRVTILKEKSPRTTQGAQAKEPWVVVKDVDNLQGMFPGVTFPLTVATGTAITAATT